MPGMGAGSEVCVGKKPEAPQRRTLGDAQKQPNQNRRPSCSLRIEPTDANGGREHDACFSSMPVPDRRLLGDLAARINFTAS